MKQLLKKNRGTRVIVFALMLTMVAWLAPINAGVVKAADNLSMDTTQSKTLKVSKKPLYKQCAKRIYESKYKPGAIQGIQIKFGKASKGKIKLYIGCFGWEFGGLTGTKAITGTVKGKTIKFKTSKWYEGDEYGVYSRRNKVSGTITLVNKNTIKLKIKSGKAGLGKSSFLKPGKTITLRYNSDTKDIFQELY